MHHGGNKMNKKVKLPLLLFVEILIILCVHLYNLDSLHGFSVLGDELGYWGNAAFFLGNDWDDILNNISYYSYGYSLFLMLIMSLPVTAVMMYRLAIIANALFMVTSFLISYYLFTRLLPDKNKILVSIACTAMAVYASYVSCSGVAWSECYLVLFVWLILLQGYFISQKITMLRILVFAAELGYIYMIHQRTIPFLIAGVIYIFALFLQKKAKAKHLIALILTASSLLVVASMIKSYLQTYLLYAAKESGNDYSAIFANMNISTLVVPTIREVAGQFYYLWTASFGIIPLGIGITVVTFIKKWKEKEDTCYFRGFVLLSFFGILGVSSIFMRLSVSRLDYLVYGRYNEIIIGFFVVMGFLGISDFVKQKNSWIILVCALVCYFVLALFLYNKIQTWNIPLNSSYHGLCATGIYWFYILRGFRVLELCGVATVVQAMLFGLLKLFHRNNLLLIIEIVCITGVWIVSGELAIQNKTLPRQLVNEPLEQNGSFWEYIHENDVSVAYIFEPISNEANIQFYMLDKPLKCVRNVNDLEELSDILIIDGNANVTDSDIDDYVFIGFLGGNSVYSLNRIDVDLLQGN